MHFAQLRCRVEHIPIAAAGIESARLVARQILGCTGRIIGEQIAKHLQGELLEQIRLQCGGQSAGAGTTLLVAQLVVLIAVVLIAVRTVANAIAGQLLRNAQNGLIARGGTIESTSLESALAEGTIDLPNLQTLMFVGVLALFALAQHSDHQLGPQRMLSMLPDNAHTPVEQPDRILHLRGSVLQLTGIHAPLRCVWIQRAELQGTKQTD